VLAQSHRILKSPETFTDRIRTQGYAFAARQDHRLDGQYAGSLQAFREEYGQFPLDPHLNAGEGFRARRYGRFRLDAATGELAVFPHAAFFQSAAFDVLYGDIHRRFAPLSRGLLENEFFLNLIRDDFSTFPLTAEERGQDFEINVHLIRIAAVPGNATGRPAPEGIHQDGYHYGVSRLFDRQNLSGAESRVHDLRKRVIDRHTLLEPTEAMYMNDRAIFHSVQPFHAEDPSRFANRDMLIALYQPLAVSPQPRATALGLTPSGIAGYLELADRLLFK